MSVCVGDRVKVHPAGVSVFVVRELAVDGDDSMVLIEAADPEAPGRHPFVFRLADLVAVAE